jgi:hypothetical protein
MLLPGKQLVEGRQRDGSDRKPSWMLTGRIPRVTIMAEDNGALLDRGRNRTEEKEQSTLELDEGETEFRPMFRS